MIAYFSWSGNTRGIAQEIQNQTGADIFEISPVEPYSSDYNTVLMEAPLRWMMLRLNLIVSIQTWKRGYL